MTFLRELISNYQLGSDEVARAVCEFDTNYRVINPVNLLRRSKEIRINMENALTLTRQIENLISEKSERLQANCEEQKLLRKEEEDLTFKLWNLRGLANILAPLVEEFTTKPSIVAFKEKYTDSKAVQIAEMTEENVEGFWLCAQLPAEVWPFSPNTWKICLIFTWKIS